MKFLSKYKNIFLAVIIAVVVFFLYTRFFSGSDEASSLLTASAGGSAQEVQIGKEFLALLLELRSLSLDQSLFEDPSFLILEDFSQEVSPQPSGRPNPFRPIGGDAVLPSGEEDNL